MKNREVNTKHIKDLLPQFTEREPDPYKQSEIDALFAACSLPVDSRASYTGEYMRVALTLMLRLGLREQEAACGTWDDCDLTARMWNVRDNLAVGFIIKDKTERAVPIPLDAVRLLEKWKKTSKAERPKGSLVLGLDDGNRVNGHLLRWLQALAKRAGMKSKIGLHRLRKTYITGLIRAKVDVPMVQQFVGHSDYASTKRYIGVATPEEKVAVIDSIKF
jgi:integrase